MKEFTDEKSDNDILVPEVSDQALEAAAFVGNLGAYTEFAYCTRFACPD